MRKLPTPPAMCVNFAPSKYRKEKPVLTKTHVGEAIRKGLLKAINSKVLAQLDTDETDMANEMAKEKWHEHEAFDTVRDPYTSERPKEDPKPVDTE